MSEVPYPLVPPPVAWAWQSCAYCYTLVWSAEPAHGDGNPCPMKEAESLALVEMLLAQKASFEGQGFMAADLKQQADDLMRKMFGADGPFGEDGE